LAILFIFDAIRYDGDAYPFNHGGKDTDFAFLKNRKISMSRLVLNHLLFPTGFAASLHHQTAEAGNIKTQPLEKKQTQKPN